MKTKFYKGQPVWHRYYPADIAFFDPVIMDAGDFIPVINLPNVWYQWDGGEEPPCDPNQMVCVQYLDGCVSLYHYARSASWSTVAWYIVIELPEVAR